MVVDTLWITLGTTLRNHPRESTAGNHPKDDGNHPHRLLLALSGTTIGTSRNHPRRQRGCGFLSLLRGTTPVGSSQTTPQHTTTGA